MAGRGTATSSAVTETSAKLDATMTQYNDEFKAQIISEWMAGSSLNQLSAVHKMPKATVQSWVRGHTRYTLPVPQKNGLEDYDFDGAAEQLIDGSVRAYKAIVRAAEDPEWIKGHSPSEAAILAGVIADKLYRLLGAIERPTDPNAIPAGTPEG